MEPVKGDSQLEPTQLQSSQVAHLSSQELEAVETSKNESPSNRVVVANKIELQVSNNAEAITKWQSKIVEETKGYTVEQLEQVNSKIHDLLWKTLSIEDREDVAKRAYEVFKEVDENVKELQDENFKELTQNVIVSGSSGYDH